MTQVAVALVSGSTQANISRIERQDNMKVSTLQELVQARGGRLEIYAVFGDEKVSLLADD